MAEHVVELGISAVARVEQDGPRQTLVLSDGKVEVRILIPPAGKGDEFPYLHVRALGQRIEHAANPVRRNTEGRAWRHGPFNGPGAGR